jgi:phosphatidylserine/phosphatidylglycerophosphate/cardiolipin synthase-like enzyme
VCEAILNAVERALDAGREFRVMIVVPEQLEETVVLEPLSYFTRRTLLQDSPLGSRGEFAEEACLRTRIQRLLAEKRPGVEADPDSILSICGLAQTQKSPAGKWCTQSVFVHSKVLLVDDKYMVCGSANVNDRSFMGDRDSELGVLLTDDHGPDMIDSTMAGKPFRSGRTLLNFRLRTFRAFLGLDEGGADDGAILDPVNAFGRVWSGTAAKNRALLSAVFKYTPRDGITSFSQWSKIKEASFGGGDDDTSSPYVEGSDLDQLTEFRGLLVKFPRLFLGDQEKRSTLEWALESIPVFQTGFL